MAVPKWKAALEKRKKEKDAADLKTFTIPGGSTTMRILPNPKDEDELFYQDYGQHWIKSMTETNAQGQPKIIAAPLCKEKTYEQHCEYCEAISEAMGHMNDNDHSFSDADIKQLKEAQARKRTLINAAIRNGSGGYEIKLVELASTAFNALIDLLDEYGEDVVKTKGGLDVVVTRKGTGMSTTYTVMPARNQGDDIADGWQAQCADLQGFADSQVLSATRVPAAIAGIGAYAGITLSAPALPHTPVSTSKDKPALPDAKFSSNDSITDDALDDLDDELDDVPLTEAEVVEEGPVEEGPVAEEPVAEAPTETTSQAVSEDEDLLAELDDLDLD